MSLTLAAGLVLAVLATAFMSGIFGMAGGMVLMLVLALAVPAATAMVIHGVVQFASNSWRTLLWRQHVRWDLTGRQMLGSLSAAAVAAVIAFRPNTAVTLIGLGLLPWLQLALPRRFSPSIERPGMAYLCGFTSTACHLVAGVSGPLYDVFFQTTSLDRRGVVATKAAGQCIGHMMKTLYAGALLAGPLNPWDDVSPWFLAIAILAAFAGTSLSRPVLERLSDVNFFRYTRWVLLVVGTISLWQGVMRL
ncbi:MAG: sulfite exporter TauE/SafE family protein [Alphaproteobacteria bacterium]|nr:TSUP family transporter [Alphaproteobacteria bacterium]TAD87335.1 MAG: sulfite exporter TauE/SafE family protein [Alphaproteobacteria bacterium]